MYIGGIACYWCHDDYSAKWKRHSDTDNIVGTFCFCSSIVSCKREFNVHDIDNSGILVDSVLWLLRSMLKYTY